MDAVEIHPHALQRMVEAYAVWEDNRWLVITVITRYF